MPELTSVRLGGRNFYSVEHVRMNNAGKMKVTEVHRGKDVIEEYYGIASHAFGIKLGIINSIAAIFKNGRVQMIENRGNYIFPSCVLLPKYGIPPYICGNDAQLFNRPKNVIHDFLPLVGVKYSDPVVKHIQESVGFTIVDDGDNNPVISVLNHGDEKQYRPEEVVTVFLDYIRCSTQHYVGYDIADAVISVPVWFSSLQRQLIRDAAVAVGLNPIRVIPDPVAAAYAHNDVLDLEKWDSPKGRVVLVYDLRSTSFSVTIQRMNGVVYSVLAYEYDLQLGGNDFDRLIRDDVIKKYKEEAEEEYGELTRRGIGMLLEKCVEAKISLAQATCVPIDFYNICDRYYHFSPDHMNDWSDDLIDDDWYYDLSRDHMNDLISGKIDESIRLCDNAIARAGLAVNDIDEIVLVGGSTRLCIVKEKLKNHFPQLEIKDSVKPEECIATGAARYAYALSTGKYFVTPSHP